MAHTVGPPSGSSTTSSTVNPTRSYNLTLLALEVSR